MESSSFHYNSKRYSIAKIEICLHVNFVIFFLKFEKKKICIGVQLLYNVVLVSTVQQGESAIHIHIPHPHFWISFSFRSPQSIE